MTGTQRAQTKLDQKRLTLDKIYLDTPRFYPDTRQIKRREIQLWSKELWQMHAKDQRKMKRSKRQKKNIPTEG